MKKEQDKKEKLIATILIGILTTFLLVGGLYSLLVVGSPELTFG